MEDIHKDGGGCCGCHRGDCGVDDNGDDGNDGNHDNGNDGGAGRVKFIVGCVLFASGIAGGIHYDGTAIVDGTVTNSMFLVSWLLLGWSVLRSAVLNITKGRVFDENFLMSAATLGAIAVGEYPEAVAVMLFYQVGEYFQGRAVRKSRKSVAALMDIRPEYANVVTDGGVTEQVPPSAVGIGAAVIVRPGEKIPLDGIVISGAAALNTSALTGEAMPRDVAEGDEVSAGTVNTAAGAAGLLTIRVTKPFSQSAVSKILDLMQNAREKKSRAENFITKFARYYTPAVVFAALALAVLPPLVIGLAAADITLFPDEFATWVHRALVFLVVSCPCALVISVPLTFFGGIGGAARRGILVKGGNCLEALCDINCVVFDKTGTLTDGTFKVAEIVPYGQISESELLRLAAHAEYNSLHPIARSVIRACTDSGTAVVPEIIREFEEKSGYGVSAVIDGQRTLAGNARYLREVNSVEIDESNQNNNNEAGTRLYIAVNGTYAGYLRISDSVKADSVSAVAALRAAGIAEIDMFTGDGRAAGEAVGRELMLDNVYAELLPHRKAEQLEQLQLADRCRNIAFVGDGINDAPVLARADVGIAMGGVGSDAAVEAADVVLMTDEPRKVAEAVGIARRTRAIVRQNIVFALGVKAVVLILGALGSTGMWEAVFADVGVSVLAVCNALRALR